MWNKYCEFKKPQISPSTYTKDFTRHRNHIAKLPSRSLDDASVIRDHLLAKLTLNSAKRCLTQFKACCNWAVEEGLIEVNPFALMKIQVPKSASVEHDVNPFTKEERDLIISTFASDRYYCHYTHYVRFLFFTGCRPSEAIALRWKHATDKVIQFRESVVVSEDGLVVKDGLKTQRKRNYPLTLEVKAILNEIRPEDVDLELLIFTSPKGKLVDRYTTGAKWMERLIDVVNALAERGIAGFQKHLEIHAEIIDQISKLIIQRERDPELKQYRRPSHYYLDGRCYLGVNRWRLS